MKRILVFFISVTVLFGALAGYLLTNNRKLKNELVTYRQEQLANTFFDFCSDYEEFNSELKRIAENAAETNLVTLTFLAQKTTASYTELLSEEGMGERVTLFINRCCEYLHFLYEKNSPEVCVTDGENENLTSLLSCSDKIAKEIEKMKSEIISLPDITSRAERIKELFSYEEYKKSALGEDNLSLSDLEVHVLDAPNLSYSGKLSSGRAYLKREYIAEQSPLDESVICEKVRFVIGKPFKFYKRSYNLPSRMGMYSFTNDKSYYIFSENGGCMLNCGKYYKPECKEALDEKYLLECAEKYLDMIGYENVKNTESTRFCDVCYFTFCDGEEEKITVGVRVSDGETVFLDSSIYIKQKVKNVL